MIITFKTAKLKKIFCSKKELERVYGSEIARRIMNRMVVLHKSHCLAEVPHVPPFRRHQLKGQYKGYFAVNLKHPLRLIFQPTNDPLPKLLDGGIDLNAVTEIEIISVKDYH